MMKAVENIYLFKQTFVLKNTHQKTILNNMLKQHSQHMNNLYVFLT